MEGGRIRGLSIEMGLAAGDINRSVSEIKRSIRGLNSEAKVTTNNFKFGEKSTKSYKEAIDTLSKSTEKQRKNLDDLGKGYSKVVEEQGASSKAAQNLATEYNKQADNLNRLESALDDAKDGMHELYVESSKFKSIETGMKGISSSFQTVSDQMVSTGKTMTASITAPIVSAITGSIMAFADLEQAVGGVETLFKDSSDAVIKNSETAYKRAGVSGVDYMENVTSFSATLLQGLGGDTEKAAAAADTAMVDMSDNANKFGTDIGSIQNAYQGFAKGNFTMLDNLKLGYGGTQEEMARLVNESGVLGDAMDVTAETVKDVDFHTLIEAIHEVQNEMGVTGTTVKEAEETVAGSFGMMKASFSDLAAGFGQEGANIDGLISNLTDSVGIFGENIKRVLGTIWDNLPMAGWQKWLGAIGIAAGPLLLIFGTIIGTVGKVIGAFAPLFGSLAKLSGGIKTVYNGIKPFAAVFPRLAGLTKLLAGAFTFLTGPIGLTVAAIAALGAGFVLAYNKSDTFRGFIDGIGEKIGGAIGWLTDFKDGILSLFKDDGMEGIDILTSIGLSQELADSLWEFTGYFIEFKNNVSEQIENVKTTIGGIFEIFKGNHVGAAEILSSVGLSEDTIGGIFLGVAKIKGIYNNMKDDVSLAFSTVGSYFKQHFGGMLDWWNENGPPFIDAVITLFGNIKNTLSGFFGSSSGDFGAFATLISGLWSHLWNTVSAVVQGAWSQIKMFIEIGTSIGQGLMEMFTAAVNGNWSEFWSILRNTASSVKDSILGHLGNLKDIGINLFHQLFGGAIQWFTNMKDGVIEKVLSLVERAVWEWERFKVLTEIKIRTMVHNVKQFFSDLWSNTTQKAADIKNGVVSRFTELKDGAINRITGLYNSVTGWFSNLYSNTTQKASFIKTAVVYAFTQLKDGTINRIVGLYNSATSWFQNIYTSVRDKMLNAKNTAVGFATDLKDGAVEQFTKLSDGAADMMDKIGQWIDDKKSAIVTKAKNLGVDLANGAIGGFNKLIGGINGVADLLGHSGDLVTPIQTVSSYSTGTSFHKGGAALVGDKGPGNGSGGGSSTREIVELPNKRQYLVDGNILFPDFPLGAKVFKNKDTEKMLGGSGSDNWIQSSAKTIGNFTKKAYHGAKDTVSGAYNSVKGFVGDVWDYAKNPGELVNKMISNLDLGFDLPSEALELASLGVNKLKSTITDFVTDLFKTADGGGDGSHILGKQIYQRFGRYTGGLSFNGGNHYGLDTAHKHEALLSPINGIISRIWNDYGGGNSIQVDAGKHTWWFMHLSKILTSVGERIKAGQKIAVTGSTGNFVSGTGHLHTQVMEGGVGNAHAIDPLPILKNLKGFATGGLVGDGIYRLGEGGYQEYVIPTDPRKATDAQKLLALASKDVGKSKRPGQLPNVSQGNDNNEIVNALVEQNGILMKMLEKLTGIEAKELILGENEIGSAADRYNNRHASKRSVKTGRLNYNV